MSQLPSYCSCRCGPEKLRLVGSIAMRLRIFGAALVCLAVALVITYKWWAAGRAEMQAATERVAAAVARSDRDALAVDPLLQLLAGTVDLLLRHSQDLAGGYQVSVSRNGADGYHLLPGVVTHVGQIKANSVRLYLGFRYDRGSGQVELVTASATSLQ